MSKPSGRGKRAGKTTKPKPVIKPVEAWSDKSLKGIRLTNMGARNLEVRPVGAWAEPTHTDFMISPEPQDDVQAMAALEEQRIRQVIQEKQDKLIKFQEDVKKRVRHMARQKKQQQLQKSYRAIQAERTVMKKVGFSLPKKSNMHCDLNLSQDIQMAQSPTPQEPEPILSDPHKQLEDKKNETSKYSREARNKLVSRKVVTDGYTSDDLPGGQWKDTWGDHIPRDAEQVETTDTMETSDDVSLSDNELGRRKSQKSRESVKSVHFDLDDAAETREERIQRKSAAEISGTDLERPLTQSEALNPRLEELTKRLGPPPDGRDLHPVISEEEMKAQARNQRAMYRRLFMDIEREQVKENQKIRQQRIKIAKMKKEVEEERRRQERTVRDMMAPRDPVTGESPREKARREAVEDTLNKEMEDRNQRIYQKAKEVDRYVDALKSNLGRKADLKNIALPLLCNCATSFWDTHPDTCANNCQFYKNPRGYAKALQSLLQSCDLA